MKKGIYRWLVVMQLLTLTGVVWAGPQYQKSDIGEGVAMAISANNKIAGDLSNGHSFVWDSTRGVHELQLVGTTSYCKGINSSGQVVGYSDVTKPHVWVYDPITGMRDLGTITPNGALGCAINDAGKIVGYSYDANYSARAFTWSAAGGFGDPGGVGRTAAYCINNSGQIAGFTDINNMHLASVWDPVTGIRVLYPSDTISFAYDISNSGYVVGLRQYGSRNIYRAAFRWDKTTGIHNLPGLVDTYATDVKAVNSNGIAVGSSSDASGQQHAVWWDLNYAIHDLGLGTAYDINDSGNIVGTSNGRAVMWSTPEPSSILALICGLGGLGGALLRKKR